MLHRRSFLQILLVAQAMAAINKAKAQERTLRFGLPQHFSYDWLKSHAEALAKKEYTPPESPDQELVAAIDYDAQGQIHFRDGYALFGDNHPSAFPITFVHVGKYFPKTVRMFELEQASGETVAREILYDPDYFSVHPGSAAARLTAAPSPIAGFWLREAKSGTEDWKASEPWVTFQGASYFRAKGELGQVGMSARGIALTPGGDTPEEFPDFVAFWFSPAPASAKSMTVYALLDGKSVAGAYRFVIQRTSGVVMEIEQTLFFRKTVERLGLAPLTSMYWYSETVKPTAIDWRPEVHDSDGLAIWTGSGEYIWRPLINPPYITISSFFDEHPRGFGLIQRDRHFDHYLDGVRYHLRPSAWVEPLDNWGRGVVQLVEIPTDDEVFDNITAYWSPEKAVQPGDSIKLSYRLHWLAQEPNPSALGRCVATRLGRGGEPGPPRPPELKKFTVEFQGGPLLNLARDGRPEVVLWSSRGSFVNVRAEPVIEAGAGHWRAHFDLKVKGRQPVDIRLFLKSGETILTETWLYQYHPFLSQSRPVYHSDESARLVPAATQSPDPAR
jgi:periplasmic glucans biosynthesis protein